MPSTHRSSGSWSGGTGHMAWRSPVRDEVTWLEISGTYGRTTPSMEDLSPQYSEVGVRLSSEAGVKDSTWKGPLPTGAWKKPSSSIRSAGRTYITVRLVS